MRESLKKIEKEFEDFFEFPTENNDSVTSASAKLFAEHCVDIVSKQYESEIDDLQGEIVQLLAGEQDSSPTNLVMTRQKVGLNAR